MKRGKGKESCTINAPEKLPAIIVTPPGKDMKVATKPADDQNVTRINLPQVNDPTTSQTNKATIQNKMAEFSVNRLIAELSENSRASKGEIEHIQRKLFQQANEILKVNAFANSQPAPEPRIIDSTQKYSNSKPVYGRIPVVMARNYSAVPQVVNTVLSNQQDRNKLDISRQNLPVANMAVVASKADDAHQADNQLGDTQLVPEKLQEVSTQFSADNAGAMINSDQGNMQRVAPSAVDAGRGVFFYETGSAASRPAASARAAPLRGECLDPLSNSKSFLFLNEPN